MYFIFFVTFFYTFVIHLSNFVQKKIWYCSCKCIFGFFSCKPENHVTKKIDIY